MRVMPKTSPRKPPLNQPPKKNSLLTFNASSKSSSLGVPVLRKASLSSVNSFAIPRSSSLTCAASLTDLCKRERGSSSFDPVHPPVNIRTGKRARRIIRRLIPAVRFSGSLSGVGDRIAPKGQESSHSRHLMHSSGVMFTCHPEKRDIHFKRTT